MNRDELKATMQVNAVKHLNELDKPWFKQSNMDLDVRVGFGEGAPGVYDGQGFDGADRRTGHIVPVHPLPCRVDGRFPLGRGHRARAELLQAQHRAHTRPLGPARRGAFSFYPLLSVPTLFSFDQTRHSVHSFSF